jgi:RNA polymerase sigma-70 factor, ECF subfamily
VTAVSGAVEDASAVVAAAAAGDVLAFERLVSLHHEDLRRICAIVVGDDSVADDAVQAAWAIAWRKLNTVRDPARTKAWLASIAVNEARRLVRRSRRLSVVEISMSSIDATGDAAGRSPDATIADIDLRNALAQLTTDDRALLALRYVAGFDSQELALATGLSPSGIRSRLARLIGRLQKELGDG